MKHLTFLCFILILQNQLISQTLTIVDDNCFGGSGNDVSEGILKLPNGNTIVYGSSNSPLSGSKNEASFGMNDGWVIMLDQNNSEIWQKTIGGTADDFIRSAIILSNGDLLMCGTSNSGVSGNKTSINYGSEDVWIIRITQSGSIVFDKSYGGLDTESCGKLMEYSPNRILVLSTSGSGISGNKTAPNKGFTDCWLLKIDSDGNLISQATIGGNDFDSDAEFFKYSESRIDLSLNSSSNISGDKSENSYGLDDIWMVSIDTNLSITNQKTIGGDASDLGTSILKLSNGNIVVIGTSDSGISGLKTEQTNGGLDTWVIELAPDFDLIREKTIGSDQDEFIFSSMLFPNNELVVLCSSSSDINEFKTQNNIGLRDIWLYKLNSSWDCVFDITIGSTGNEAAKMMVSESSNSISVVNSSNGSNNNDKTCLGYGENDFWLIDFNSSLNSIDLISTEYQAFPNPFSESLTLELGDELVQIRIFAINGKEYAQFNASGKYHADLSQLDPGTYFLQLTSEKGTGVAKVVKE
jgi:hypothetical protein